MNEFKSVSSGSTTPVPSGAHANHGSSHKRTKSNVQPQICLVSEKDELFAVSAFHTQSEPFPKVKGFVKAVMSEFTRIYGKEVAALRSTLDAMADAAANNKPPTSAGMKPEAILFRFEKFESTLESLREKGGL